MRLRTLIADDEQPARRRLLDLLGREPDIEIVGAARNGHEAVDLIASERPELLFLDIQMPVLDGFGVLKSIPAGAMPVVVFVTAYDQYAIRAFEAHALDYLLKPFSDERFESTLARARHSIRTHRAGEVGERVALLLQQALPDGAPQYLDRIVLRSGGRVTFLDVDEIDWIEAQGVYVNLHAGQRVHLHRTTLAQIHQQLDPRRFVRVHRSAVVNTSRIRELQPRSHGDYTIVLKNNTTLQLSRKFRSELEQWLRQPF